MSTSGPKITRRALFSGAIGAGVLLTGFRAIKTLVSDTLGPEHRFVACYFNGAWDVLLGADARDPAGSYPGIDLGTQFLAPQYQTPINLSVGGSETLWGAPMAALVPHADVATVFRGINMNTVAHPTGRAYVNTYLPPAGVVARGSSLSTVVSSIGDLPHDRIMPNVSIGVPSFNTEYAPEFTAVPLQVAPEILGLLRPGSELLPGDVETLLLAAQDDIESCVSGKYPGPHPIAQLRDARERVRQLLAEDVGQHFDLGADTPDMIALRARYGFTATTPRTNPRDPGVVAAVTAQLLKTGLARSITCQLQQQLDTHGNNWATVQPTRLQDGFEALAALIDDLRQDDPDMAHTTVVAYSEFARTPKLNGQTGRDHWFANSVLVFGGVLRSGVCGASRQDNLGLQNIDPVTGLPDESGMMLKPEHIGATLVKALGGDPSPFRVSPLDAWIAGGAS